MRRYGVLATSAGFRQRRQVALLLALLAVQHGWPWVASPTGLAHGLEDVDQDGGIPSLATPSDADTDDMDELWRVLGDNAAARELLTTIKAGPLPGLAFIPGFPGGGGLHLPPFNPADLTLLGRLGVLPSGAAAGAVGAAAAAEAAFASYVVLGQDPVAIALRQLSIVAIAAYGTAVQNAIDRAIRDIDGLLGRYSAYLQGIADAIDDNNVEQLEFMIEREIRVLVIIRAALEDMGARLDNYAGFLSAATSSWVSFFYGQIFRFRVLQISLISNNDPFGFEYVRVLYSLADVQKLVGLVLKPFLNAENFAATFFNELNGILYGAYSSALGRFTATPSVEQVASGGGPNLQSVIDRILSFAGKVGSGEALEALLKAVTTGRDHVIAALRHPGPDGRSNTTGIFRDLMKKFRSGSDGSGVDGMSIFAAQG